MQLKPEIIPHLRIKVLLNVYIQRKLLLIFPAEVLGLALIPPMWAFSTHRTMI